jgi:hypothetical protein
MLAKAWLFRRCGTRYLVPASQAQVVVFLRASSLLLLLGVVIDQLVD